MLSRKARRARLGGIHPSLNQMLVTWSIFKPRFIESEGSTYSAFTFNLRFASSYDFEDVSDIFHSYVSREVVRTITFLQ